MPTPETSGREPETIRDSAGQSGWRLRNIGVLTAAMTAMLLSQAGHNPEQKTPAVRKAIGADIGKLTDGTREESLESMRAALRTRVNAFADVCGVSEASTLAMMCGDKPLTGEKVSAAASKLSPELRSELHKIAEILRDYPELAPDVLNALNQYLAELSMMNPKKLACLAVPASDESLEDHTMVYVAARQFLESEKELGAYKETPEMQMAESRVLIQRILTEQRNRSEGK